MKRLAIVLALLAAAVAAVPSVSTRDAVAGVTFTQVSGEVVGFEFVAEGTEAWRGAPVLGTPWGDMPGTVYSKRDMVLMLEVAGGDYIAGVHTSEFGYELNFRTWSGAGFGTVRIDPTAYSPSGWFDCRQSYAYAGGFPPSWSGPIICQGSGTLDGVQLRLHVEHDSQAFTTTFDGYAFAPGS